MKVYDRLLMELSNQQYLTEEQYKQFLSENDLNPNDDYVKSDMQKPLLFTVLDVLEAVANDIDVMSDISTEFVDIGQAYAFIEERINGVKNKIAAIPDPKDEYTNFSLMYTNGTGQRVSTSSHSGGSGVSSDELEEVWDELDSKQDKLIAGDNITISNNTISSSESVELTKAEYNALSEEERMNGKTYFVTDENSDSGNSGGSGGSGGSSSVDITIDSSLSSSSTNPVQNRTITNALKNKQDTLTFDTTPKANSSNPITSGGVYSALQSQGSSGSSINVDSSISATSHNPVENQAIYAALTNKQNILTFDTTPTMNSNNPVTSGGIYSALQNISNNGGGGTSGSSGSSETELDVNGGYNTGLKWIDGENIYDIYEKYIYVPALEEQPSNDIYTENIDTGIKRCYLHTTGDFNYVNVFNVIDVYPVWCLHTEGDSDSTGYHYHISGKDSGRLSGGGVTIGNLVGGNMSYAPLEAITTFDQLNDRYVRNALYAYLTPNYGRITVGRGKNRWNYCAYIRIRYIRNSKYDNAIAYKELDYDIEFIDFK